MSSAHTKRAARNQLVSEFHGSPVQQEAGNPDIPVTIIDVCGKDTGEAPTYQTRMSEGYYLKTEWNSGMEGYGSISSQNNSTESNY